LSSENTVRSRSVVVSITRYTHFLFAVWIVSGFVTLV
jgi:hypothetical protein